MRWLEGHKRLGTKLSTTKKTKKVTTIILVSFIDVWKTENQHPIRIFLSSKKWSQEKARRRRLGFRFLQEEQYMFFTLLGLQEDPSNNKE
jgi:hypothetical protein